MFFFFSCYCKGWSGSSLLVSMEPGVSFLSVVRMAMPVSQFQILISSPLSSLAVIKEEPGESFVHAFRPLYIRRCLLS